jgi:hypothetical protein
VNICSERRQAVLGFTNGEGPVFTDPSVVTVALDEECYVMEAHS